MHSAISNIPGGITNVITSNNKYLKNNICNVSQQQTNTDIHSI